VQKLSIVATFLALVACAGMAFSIMETRKVTTALEDRLAKLEGAPAAAGGNGPATGGGSSTGTPSSVSEVAQELTKLKAEMAAVKSQQETIVAAAAGAKNGGTPAATGDKKPVALASEEVKAAVEEVLAAKEKEKAEKDAKRTADMLAGAQQRAVDKLVTELGLTEQQKSQVAEILTVQMAAFRDAFTNRKDGEDMGTKIADLRKETDTKMKAVLTPEQGVKYDELAKNPMALFGGGGGGFGGGGFGGGGRRGGGQNGGN
jgi:hypothetical protein